MDGSFPLFIGAPLGCCATEFSAAYLALLRGYGAERVGDRTLMIPDSPFADAFFVERDADVIVANAPSVDDLVGVYPPPGR